MQSILGADPTQERPQRPNRQGRRRPLSFSLITGAICVLVAGSSLAGWLLHLPLLVDPFHYGWAAVISADLCLMLCGLMLLISEQSAKGFRGPDRMVLMGLLTAIPLGSLIENLINRDLGLDFAAWHAFFPTGSTVVGRMPALQAIAFLCCAAAFILLTLRRTPLRQSLVGYLAWAIYMVGLVSVYCYWRDLQWVFERSARLEFLRTSPAASVALILLSAVLWRKAYAQSEIRGAGAVAERRRSAFWSAAAVMCAVILVGWLIGFSFFQSSVLSVGSANLTQAVTDRALLLEHSISSAARRATSAADPAPFAVPLRAFDTNPSDPRAVAQLYSATRTLEQRGLPAVAFEGATGGFLALDGFVNDTSSQINLKSSSAEGLLWANGYKLDLGFPVVDTGGLAGFVILQQPLDWPANFGFENGQWGGVSRVGLCGSGPHGEKCFPQDTLPGEFGISPGPGRAPERPDLTNNRGTVTAKGFDRQGRRVLAAASPVGALGLEMMAETGVAELFSPLKTRIRLAWLSLALVLISGIGLLRFQIRDTAGAVTSAPTLAHVSPAPVSYRVNSPLLETPKVDWESLERVPDFPASMVEPVLVIDAPRVQEPSGPWLRQVAEPTAAVTEPVLAVEESRNLQPSGPSLRQVGEPTAAVTEPVLAVEESRNLQPSGPSLRQVAEPTAAITEPVLAVEESRNLQPSGPSLRQIGEPLAAVSAKAPVSATAEVSAAQPTQKRWEPQPPRPALFRYADDFESFLAATIESIEQGIWRKDGSALLVEQLGDGQSWSPDSVSPAHTDHSQAGLVPTDSTEVWPGMLLQASTESEPIQAPVELASFDRISDGASGSSEDEPRSRRTEPVLLDAPQQVWATGAMSMSAKKDARISPAVVFLGLAGAFTAGAIVTRLVRR